MNLLTPTKIEIKSSPGKGMGVFAIDHIGIGEIIEECHLVSLHLEKNVYSPVLEDYRFVYPKGPNFQEYVMPLGYAGIYNHSNEFNADWNDHPYIKAFQFYATKNIIPGEEICIYYGDGIYWSYLPNTKII
jgi:hypothetical protein